MRATSREIRKVLGNVALILGFVLDIAAACLGWRMLKVARSLAPEERDSVRARLWALALPLSFLAIRKAWQLYQVQKQKHD